MSKPQPPKPGKLLIGIILKEKSLLVAVANELVEKFGSVDLASTWFPFTKTTYYEPEMGTPLFRRMLTFKRLISQDALAEIKLQTNELERKYSVNCKRNINVDPGYLLHERFVLATGKNYTHRIFIGHGIYADLTLIYTKGSFQPLSWTYPDYVESHMLSYLDQVRKKYLMDLKQIYQSGVSKKRIGKE